MPADALLFCILFLLAYSNGANDISKGIATLVGSDTANLRRAVGLGVVATALGCLAAVLFGDLLLTVFSTGLLAAASDWSSIALASGAGAALWVLLASWLGLPVSTTHALVGGILGAGMFQFGAAGITWNGVATKAFLPLLISPLVSFGFSFALFHLVKVNAARAAQRCVCIEDHEAVLAPSHTVAIQIVPSIRVVTGNAQECESDPSVRLGVRATDALHFMSAGLTCFARGLNDAPKIAALLAGAHASGSSSLDLSYSIVAMGMLVGGVAGGKRVLHTLSRRITPLDSIKGLVANGVTATLVTAGSLAGLPFSTTHVSASSITGIGSAGGEGVQWAVVRDIVVAWLITLPGAAVAAFIIQYATT